MDPEDDGRPLLTMQLDDSYMHRVVQEAAARRPQLRTRVCTAEEALAWQSVAVRRVAPRAATTFSPRTDARGLPAAVKPGAPRDLILAAVAWRGVAVRRGRPCTGASTSRWTGNE